MQTVSGLRVRTWNPLFAALLVFALPLAAIGSPTWVDGVIVSASDATALLSLEKPFGSSPKGFPSDEAGMCAYVTLDQAVDIEDLVSKRVFALIEDVGEDYILGIVPIGSFGGDIDVHLYAQTDGWIGAYFGRNDPAAKIMQWYPSSIYGQDISTISRTTLGDALNATGIDNMPEPKYYHFGYPYAKSVILLVKLLGALEKTSCR